MTWLRDMSWPVAGAVLDGEAVAGDGHEGVQAVFAERDKPGGDMAFMAFDMLELDGRRVLREPWRDRRKRLEDLFGNMALPRVGLVPVTEDAAGLYEDWIGMGGEGIVLKERRSYGAGRFALGWRCRLPRRHQRVAPVQSYDLPRPHSLRKAQPLPRHPGSDGDGKR